MKIVLKDQLKFNEIVMRKGFSKSKLAKTADLSHAYIFQICHGERHLSPGSAQKITQALGVEFDDVFTIKHDQKEVSVK